MGATGKALAQALFTPGAVALGALGVVPPHMPSAPPGVSIGEDVEDFIRPVDDVGVVGELEAGGVAPFLAGDEAQVQHKGRDRKRG